MPDISLSTLTYDPDGCIDLAFEKSSEGIHDRARRVGRQQTLDGGVSLTYGGIAHGDRTFVLRVRVSKSQRDILKYLYDTYPEVRCSTQDGLFRVAMETLNFDGNLATMRLLVVSKEA